MTYDPGPASPKKPSNPATVYGVEPVTQTHKPASPSNEPTADTLSGLPPVRLLAHLQARDIDLWTEDGRLRFSAPKGAMTDAIRAALKARKAELITFLEQATVTQGDTAPIVPVSHDGPLPLTFGQERLWFLDRLEPGNPAYNIAQALQFDGAFDVEALRRAVSDMAQRHAVLRTTFTEVSGVPHQVIHPELPIALDSEDLRELDPDVRQQRLEGRLAEERRRPFDLETDALMRLALFRMDEDTWVLHTVVHHIIADGWSAGILIQELMALYVAAREERPAELPPLTLQYADFASWQRQHLTPEVLAPQLEHWLDQLDGAPTTLELPTDRPRGRHTDAEGQKYVHRLPRRLSEDLARLNQERGTTPFMALLAAFQVLLGRHSHQHDLSVGSPMANRNRPELEGLVGFFVNTLVFRGNLATAHTLADHLETTRQRVLSAFENQDLPFERLVEVASPERSSHQNPLFQVAFALQNANRTDLDAGDRGFQTLPAKGGLEPFELTLYAWEQGEDIELSWQYRRALYDATTIHRMAVHFEVLLGALTQDPQQPWATAPLLTPGEHHQVLHEVNDTHSDYPRHATVPERFAAQAAETPDALALVFDDASMTYAEVRDEAAALAAHLRSLGVSHGTPVGLLMERSARTVVGFLAVLQTGGFYLPLDPAYPDVRIAFMLQDTAAPVVLVDTPNRPRLEGLVGDGVHVVPSEDRFDGVDSAASKTAAPKTVAPETSALGAEALAYVIYTSGSTGRPKGVAVSHRSILRLVLETDYLQLAPSHRVAQLSNTSFDAATFEIWGALLNGATLFGIPKSVALEPRHLATTLAEREVDQLFITTALFNQVIRETPEAFSGLHHVLFGGEAVDPQRVREAQDANPQTRFLHVYGPTECTTFASWHPVGVVDADDTTIPIGRGIANTTLHTVDPGLRPVPFGIDGELMIGGDGLAWGYWNRPALSAERFIPNPFATQPGERLYRTGDLVRWTPRGEIEFLGRIDHQVKLRGFRIELGEIESTLMRHPRVADAVVLIHRSASGDRQLVAWLSTSAAPSEPLDATLRAFLRETLPDHMVPARFVVLDAMPLTPNGKIDRKALAGRDLPQSAELPSADGPQTYAEPTEEILVGVWSDLLDRPDIDVDADFFELGGHSLLATQLMSRVRELFQVDLPLQVLFEGPTVKELARAVRLARLEAQDHVPPPLVKVPRDGALPLSFAQQRLWFFDQFQPGSAVYNVPSAMHLRGAIDPPLLEAIFNEVVRRHENLRTTFTARRGKPRQRIAEHLHLPLPIFDLRHLDATRRDVEVRRLAAADAAKPFHLTTGPLIRCACLVLGHEEFVVLVNMHHIISDGWSTDVFLKELLALYTACTRGEASPLPELDLQYADFAQWQRHWLSEATLDAELAFWKGQLHGAPRVLELPTDRPRPLEQSFRGRTSPWRPSAELGRSIEAFAQRRGATLFMTLLAAFKVVLARWSGQRDIVVGTPIAGRHHREIEGLIGFFVNTLVLRTRLEDGGFGPLVDTLRRSALEAYAHQDLPFERLVEEVAPERDLSISPVFQVMFALRHTTEANLSVPGLEIGQLQRQATTSKFDLLLSVQADDRGIRGSLEYSTDLFDGTTIRRFLGHFDRLLDAAVADPNANLSEIPLLTQAERHQMIHEWSGEATDYPRHRTIPELFTAQALATPEAPALLAGDQVVTYGELEERANRLAHHLQTLEVGPEVLVGVAMERSPELIVTLLAILKAGGAYMPLEVHYPEERLIFLLEDASTPVVVTHGSALEQMEGLAEIVLGERFPAFDVVDLDRDAEAIAACDSTAPEPGITADSLAYVVYTSGSTGEPKGVGAVHRGVVRLVRNTDFATLDAEQIWLQFAPVAFDASTLEVWGPLLNGGRLAIYPGSQASLEELGEVIERHGVNSAWLTAGLFHRLVEDRPEALRGIRQLLAGGDVLSPTHVQKALDGMPGATLINGYGPTENTTFTCCHPMADGAAVISPVPVGRPIANTTAHLLGDDLRTVPLGVVGELVTGGDGLARGYFNRPSLTADRFRPNPFAQQPGERIYHTGDLARFRADGTFEFLGRRDHQVKLRGFRIELGEIETTLGKYPGIRETVVHVWERPAAAGRVADKQLVGYLVADSDPAPTAEELRPYLAEILPDHMVPATFMALDALPLNANGKVDRKALPEPRFERADDGGSRAPSGPTEELLAGIWQEVLGVSHVGALDNFFELGGHSLLATQVVSRVRETFDVELILRQLFESPNIATLAETIDAMRRSQEDREAPPIVPIERQGELPLSFAQQRLWFLDQLETERAVYNIPGAVRLRGTLDVDLLEQVFEEIVDRHESLRTHFLAVDGRPQQVIQTELELPFSIVDLGPLDGAQKDMEVERQIQAAAQQVFDLATGPLFNIRLLRLDEADHVMLITMHHIISDGWSSGLFYGELCNRYTAHRVGKSSELPPLPIQYVDFAQWQRTWLSGQTLENELDFWRQQLAGIPQQLELPLDRPRPPYQTFVGRLLPVHFPSGLTADLAALSRTQGSTFFMVLLAAFELLLARYSGQSDIVVGSPIAGRNRQEIEHLIGFFVNVLVLRTQVDEDATFAELLEQIRQVSLDAYAHQDVPFERLVELVPERDLSISPIFQVMFAWQNAEGGFLEIPGLEIEQLVTDAQTAKFDLLLSIQESREGITGVLEYNTDLFDEVTVLRFVDQYQRLLEGIVQNPDAHSRHLELLSPSQRHQLLVEWNEAPAPAPHGDSTAADTFVADTLVTDTFVADTLDRRFARQVERTPEATALVVDDQRWSYARVGARVDTLARRLRDLGVGPETRVGLALPRTDHMVVGLLATLRAGGTYVALDPAYPRERLAWMVDDAGIRVLLKVEAVDSMVDGQDITVLDLDTVSEANTVPDAPASDAALDAPGHGPRHLAYLLYTSGSTGRPKGVAIEHRSAVALLDWAQKYFDATDRSAVLAATSINFDLSVFELFLPLTTGGTVLLARDAMALADLPAASEVRLLNTVPSAATELLRLGAIPASVRTVCLAGEPLRRPLVDALYATGTVESVWNLYGPSEDTTYSTFARIPRTDEVPSIGRPVDGTVAHVLDLRGRPVPLGAVGELHLGGDGLARGYAGRPAQTAAAFVPDPWGDGGRLYRTGDLVRRRGDGSLDFLGRRDHQVKVRGFRIELGEIETLLLDQPGVDEAAVLTHRDSSGAQLVAYVSGSDTSDGKELDGKELDGKELDGPRLDSQTLRQALAERLPAHMVPGLFVILRDMPHTPSGKIDRRRLTAPDAAGVGHDASFEPPQNGVEELIAGVWEEVLGLWGVGRQANFFELGGHSLLATQMVFRLHQLGFQLHVSDLFRNPTVETLAQHVTDGDGTEAPLGAAVLLPMRRRGSRRPLILVHGADGSASAFSALTQALDAEQPILAFQGSPKALDSDVEPSLTALAEHYIELLRAEQPEGPYRLGGWSMGGLIALEMARRLQATDEVESLILIDSSLYGSDEPISPLVLMATIARALGVDISAGADALDPETLDEEALLRRLADLCRQQGILPDTGDSDAAVHMLRRMYGTYRANTDVWSHYRPEEPYDGPVLYLAAENNVLLETAMPEAELAKTLATGPAVRRVNGDHFTMIRRPHVVRLAEALAEHLGGEV